MIRKLFIVSCVVFLLLGILACYHFYGSRYVITLSEDQIQEKLAAKFPIEKNYLRVLRVTLSKPKVRLHEGSSRIHFSVEAAATFVGTDKVLRGSGEISGEIRYEPAKGELYFDDSRIIQLRIRGLPEKYTEKISAVATLGAKEYLDKKPIYTLKPSDFKKSLAKLLLKRVVVQDGRLKITLGVGDARD